MFEYEEDPVFQYMLWEFVNEGLEEDEEEPPEQQYEIGLTITIEDPPDAGSGDERG